MATPRSDELGCGRCRRRPVDCGQLCDVCYSIAEDERRDALAEAALA